MSTILITGASGFIGQALAASLAKQHEVICMGRRDPRPAVSGHAVSGHAVSGHAVSGHATDGGVAWVRGFFGAFEDLRQLDDTPLDGVVHLAAVTGGCLERDGIGVNVEGTRCLMRYLMDRGVHKFVLASSIAAVGMQSVKFRPLQLPVPDEHPCLDRDGYGLSKFLMEEVAKYYQRQDDALDVIALRLASIVDDDPLPPLRTVGPLRQWALGGITLMARSDAVRAFSLAIEAPYRPGMRIMNAVGPKAWVADPVAEVLRNWWGDDVDLSHFERPGHEYDAVYCVDRIRAELGFVAERLP